MTPAEAEDVKSRAQALAAKIASLAAKAAPEQPTMNLPPKTSGKAAELQERDDITVPTPAPETTQSTSKQEITAEYVMSVINGMSAIVRETKRIFKKRPLRPLFL